jgi:MFS family permease
MSTVRTQAHFRRRWRIACLLSLGVFVNYVDRVNLSAAHTALRGTFGISDVTFGWLLSAYSLTYAVCQLPMGVLIDRFGVRLLGGLSAATVCLASFLAAVSPNIVTFFCARFLLGIGESPLFPSNAKATGHWFPKAERGFATSVFDSSAKLASGIGVPIVGLLLLKFGWRWSFAATGLFTLFYLVLFLLVYREPAKASWLSQSEREYIRRTAVDDSRSRSAKKTPPFQLLAEPQVIGILMAMAAYNFSFYLCLTWLPTYLSREQNLNLKQSFMYTGVPWLVATAVELFIGGWWVDRLVSRSANPGQMRKLVIGAGLSSGLAIVGVVHAHSPGIALLWITVSLAGSAGATPTLWSVPSIMAAPQNVATLGGLMNLSGQIAGISAPIVTGYLVTWTHSFGAAFGIAFLFQLLGVGSCMLMVRSIEPLRSQTS